MSAGLAQTDVAIDTTEWMTTEEIQQKHQSESLVVHADSMPLTQKEMDRLFWKPDPP